MISEVPDLVIGVVFFTVLIGLSILFGKILQSAKKSRHARAISTLAPYIQGTAESDEHSAWITGKFRGIPVRATMTPNRNISQSSEYSIRVNSFELTMLHLKGIHSWEINYTGILRKKWQIKTLDGSFKEQLRRAGIIQQLEKAGNHPSVGYNAREAVLWYSEDVRPQVVPTPQHFQAQLKLLAYIAELNEELNTRSVHRPMRSMR